jgi:hypothetical protein
MISAPAVCELAQQTIAYFRRRPKAGDISRLRTGSGPITDLNFAAAPKSVDLPDQAEKREVRVLDWWFQRTRRLRERHSAHLQVGSRPGC